MTWYKAKWIDPFFAALSTIAPDRDKASDGTIGDLAHATGVSGHNPDDTPGVQAERTDSDSRPEVRAADAGSNLRSPITMQQVVNAILAYPPDRDRLIYIIFNGAIWSASNGWRKATYTGSDKHRTHVHLSGNAASDEDGRPWRSVLELVSNLSVQGDDDMNLSDSSPWGTQFTTEPGIEEGPWLGGNMGNQLQYLREDAHFARQLARRTALEVTALRSVIDTLAKVINDAGGDVDVAVLLEAMDSKLEEVMKEQRDAVADLGEGGAAQVRADA